MVLLTVLFLAMDVGFGWLRSRYDTAKLRAVRIAIFMLFLVLIYWKLTASSGTITIHIPSQKSLMISFGLVTIYFGGRRLYDLYCLATGKARSPLQSYILDKLC